MKKMALLAATVALVSSPAIAEKRIVPVPAGAGWQHSQTGVILMPKLGTFVRSEIGDLGTNEMDLVVQYHSDSASAAATLYLFHPGLDSLPIWFDRVLAAATVRKELGIPEAEPVPSAFPVRPGQAADGLRVAIALKEGTNRSTAIAIASLDDWLLVVRLSSATLDVLALDAELTTILRSIGWPEAGRAAAAAVPVVACNDRLQLKRARTVKADLDMAVLNAIIPKVAARRKRDPQAQPDVYCRDREGPNGQWGLYRLAGSETSYVLALGDAGRAIFVEPSLSGLLGSRVQSYAISLADVESWSTFPNLDRLPPPEQALEIVSRTAPISRTTLSGGKTNVTMDMDALKTSK